MFLDKQNIENKKNEIQDTKKLEENKLKTSEKIKIITILALYFIIPMFIFAILGTKLFHFNGIYCALVGFAFAFILGYCLGLHKPVDL